MRLLPALILVLGTCWTSSGQTYSISTLAGGGLPTGISGTSASLYGPQAVAVDSTGNVYFSDQNDVLRLDPKTGFITVVAGNGTPGFSGDGGVATSAQLNQPHAVAVDASGNIYIADTSNLCIREISNGVINTVAGNPSGQPGFSGDNGPATSAQLFYPDGVAVDTAGNIYIADTNNSRIRKVSSGTITTIAGGGSVLGDNVPATTAELSQPHGVAVDSSGNVYIADSYSHRIRKVSNGTITTVVGTGTPGFSGDNGPATSATLFLPQGVTLDSAGNIYIADTNNNRIRKVSNGTITTVAGNGTAGYNSDNVQATSAELNLPAGVAVDSTGNLYIADTSNARIRKVVNGTITTLAGDGSTGFSGDNGPAIGAELNQPQGVAVDTSGNVYIADTGNNRVRMISSGVIATIAGNGTQGFSGDQGPATSAELNQPKGIAVDTSFNVYVADTGNNRIREISNGTITTIAGGGTLTTASGTATSIQLNQPQGVATDSAGNLYIADTGNNRVRQLANGFITTVAGNGTQGFSGDSTSTSTPFADTAQLNQPQSLAVDSSDNLYVADTGNNRIRLVVGGYITTIVGGGSSLGDNGAPTSAQLFSPRGIAIDSSDDLFIADTSDERVRGVLNSSGANIITLAGTGIAGFSGDNGPSTNAQLNTPKGVAVDSSGNVYIADEVNDRIRLLTSGTAPSITQGGVVENGSSVPIIQPGSWVTIYGTNLASGTATWDGTFPIPTSLGGVSVTVNGNLAYLWYVSASQINLEAPDDTTTGPVNVVVTSSDTGTATSTVTLAPYSPSFSTFDGKHVAGVIPTPNGGGTYGSGGSSYDLVGPPGDLPFTTQPVDPGQVLELYGVGFGPTTPTQLAGQPVSVASPTNSPVTITIGGINATVLFAGLTETGLYQINVVIPSNAGSGDQAIRATVNGVQSPLGPVVTIE